jgi:hypothetical protein
VTLLRGSVDFRDAVIEAASRVGIAERQVEKDYWVTATLRELVERLDGRFLFKGGTSLSKAYRLVERFSEDIDLLLLSDEGAATEDLLDAVAAAVSQVCGTTPTVDGGTEGFARRLLFAYPEIPNTRKAPGMRRQIVVEPGVRGGPRPYERRVIQPLMAEVLGPDVAFDDLAPFEIDVLHPARTMIEKLFAVDSMGRRLAIDPELRLPDTAVRHFYDLYFLLDEERSPALGWLRQGDNHEEVVADCLRVARRWFSEETAVPDGGFAHSSAFADESLASRLRPPYERMMAAVCYPRAPRPTLDEVRSRARDLEGRI